MHHNLFNMRSTKPKHKNIPRITYKSLWDTAKKEEKKEMVKRIDNAYDIIFEDITLSRRKGHADIE